MTRGLTVLITSTVLTVVLVITVIAQSSPEFRLGFKALAAQIPSVAGSPLEEEHYGPNGDSLQRTTTGLMVWRKADNWTAFTNGSRTWVNGPFGVMERANDDRFDWESPASSPSPTPSERPSASRSPARYVALGDSITESTGNWFGLAIAGYRPTGWTHNVAVGGAKVVSSLAGQVTSVAGDNADMIFIMMGINDGAGVRDASFVSAYQGALEELAEDHPNAVIYAMGILDSATSASAVTHNNPLIQRAVANAQALGVPVTYWDTDGWIDPKVDTFDGLHPNRDGYAKIAAEVVALLRTESR